LDDGGSDVYVIEEAEEWDFERAGVRGKGFVTGELTGRAGYLVIETDSGHSTTIIERESDFVYYVLGGQGAFKIGGHLETCKSGDLVVIPAGKEFNYTGKLRLLLISSPIWTAEQEVIVE
jgi:mannose-6-phosphate isomerase-like protein (cupin superfamily)